MFRSRLAAVVVSSGLMMLSGCMQWGCGPSLFPTPWTHTTVHECDCACNSTIPTSSMMLPAETMIPSTPQVISTFPPTSTSPPIHMVPGAMQLPMQ